MSNADNHAAHADVSDHRQRLYAEALELSADQRAELAWELLESIDDGDEGSRATSQEWADAWAAEIATRLALLDAGAPTIPAEEVLASLRRGR